MTSWSGNDPTIACAATGRPSLFPPGWPPGRARVRGCMVKPDNDDEDGWYFVPRKGYGFDIIHGATGMRLDVDDNNQLQLSDRLHGMTH